MTVFQPDNDTLTIPLVAPLASRQQPVRPLRVGLVNMPFASTRRPSIQLGLLRSIAERDGHAVTCHYFNLMLGERIGWKRYEILCEGRERLHGEWLFSRAAFGEQATDGQTYLDAFPDYVADLCKGLECEPSWLLDLREQTMPAFIDACLEQTDWNQYDVVGFSSIFEQNCAALALARRIKQRFPGVVIVFGGANFEDEMGLEYVRALPWLDYAVAGEADQSFPALLARLAAGARTDDLPGVVSRGADGSVCFTGRAPMVTDLDASPEPNFDDYFAAAVKTNMPQYLNETPVMIPFETARGCWWGAKHHCTFCGLNGLGMAYRSKSPAKALAGIEYLAEQYLNYSLVAVDNIMDQRYINEIFAPLAERHLDYTFFYEVKANLTRQQLKTLARGGVRHLQPGIESLSTHVLKLMRKGTTSLQNVRFLKWAQYYGIRVSWNILLGFPGETEADYRRQAEIARLIPHLRPPSSMGRIWLERFSPNFSDAAALGFTNVRPQEAYDLVYPRDINRERIAYFFAYDSPNTLPDSAYQELVQAGEAWQKLWKSATPYLVYQRGAGRLTITDGRGETPRVLRYGELAARVYESCSSEAHGINQVVELVSADAASVENRQDRADVEAVLGTFVADGLMLEEDGHYLSLALPLNLYW